MIKRAIKKMVKAGCQNMEKNLPYSGDPNPEHSNTGSINILVSSIQTVGRAFTYSFQIAGFHMVGLKL